MSISRQTVIDRYPEFSDIEAGTYFDSVIASAQRQVSKKSWGALYTDGVLAMAAHMLEQGRSHRVGKSGAIETEKVGELMRSFSVDGFGNDPLLNTSYGAEFSRMRKQLPTRPLIC
jgi:hypothetical protein